MSSREWGFYRDGSEPAFTTCRGRGGTLLCVTSTCQVAPWGGSYLGGEGNN